MNWSLQCTKACSVVVVLNLPDMAYYIPERYVQKFCTVFVSACFVNTPRRSWYKFTQLDHSYSQIPKRCCKMICQRIWSHIVCPVLCLFCALEIFEKSQYYLKQALLASIELWTTKTYSSLYEELYIRQTWPLTMHSYLKAMLSDLKRAIVMKMMTRISCLYETALPSRAASSIGTDLVASLNDRMTAATILKKSRSKDFTFGTDSLSNEKGFPNQNPPVHTYHQISIIKSFY